MKPEIKVRDIPFDELKKEIYVLLKQTLLDMNQSITDEVYEHSYKRIAYLLSNFYKSFIWIDVLNIFSGISSGLYDVKKFSVTAFTQCCNAYKNKQVEKNRIDYEKKEGEFREANREAMKTPYGLAIIFRMEQRAAENDYYEQFTLHEVAEMIENGKIEFTFTPEKRGHKIFKSPKRKKL